MEGEKLLDVVQVITVGCGVKSTGHKSKTQNIMLIERKGCNQKNEKTALETENYMCQPCI